MQTYVDWHNLQANLHNIKNCASQIDSLLSELHAAKKELDYKTTTPQIDAQLRKVTTQVIASRKNILLLQNIGEKIVCEYSFCEQNLTNTDILEPATADYNWKTAAKLIGSAGLAGKMVDSIYGLSVGGSTCWKSTAKIVESGAKVAQRMADGKIVDLFGNFAVGNPSLSKELGKYVYDSSKCATVAARNASKIAVGAKWVSLAFSGLLNFNKNFEEFDGNLKNGRMYAETISETAIDVGTGIGIGLLGTLIVGSAAPVWAAGAVAVGITSVCNVAVEWIETVFNVDVKEVVSDFAVDTYEFVRDTTKKAVSATKKFVGNAVSKTADCISAGWRKFKSWF